MNTAAADLPRVKNSKSGPKPWENDLELQALLADRKAVWTSANYNRREYKNLSRKITKRIGQLKNQHFLFEANKITAAIESKNLSSAYTIAKEQKSLTTKKPKALTCKGLDEHFKSHFNPDFTNEPTPLALQK